MSYNGWMLCEILFLHVTGAGNIHGRLCGLYWNGQIRTKSAFPLVLMYFVYML